MYLGVSYYIDKHYLCFDCLKRFLQVLQPLWLHKVTKCSDLTRHLLVAQQCPTLSNPMGYSPPGSYVHGILQARILEWVAIPFSRETSQPGIEPSSPTLQADSLPSATRKVTQRDIENAQDIKRGNLRYYLAYPFCPLHLYIYS